MDSERFKALLLEVKKRGSTDEEINEAELLNYIQDQLKKQINQSKATYE
ncbi:hypothetical protein [Salisediminibacterium halotolerans]|nr:hypothetical protein [Salisediminibacterium halotolerans]RLJ75618.1 hypothetical protein BCL39_1135 [Actinophytocola xinjiangensis]RPE89472.1 hypothetical protein EDD67_0248 [Salisediminibacterium halotolerans]TWG36231.1 hypothetical protein BCL52_1132 [Salisediminibacterium halotolerans]GEL08493.1 hypothetical protein SHA02_19090 [Salisediminibacterium halotolerans]